MKRYNLSENGEKEFTELCAALRAEGRKKSVTDKELSASELAEYFLSINKK